MKVGLIGVTALRCNERSAVAGGKAMSGVIESDQLSGSLRSDADLRSVA
jgi:hypothetical protein